MLFLLKEILSAIFIKIYFDTNPDLYYTMTNKWIVYTFTCA